MIGEFAFYEKPSADYRKSYLPGQIFYTPIPFFCSNKIEVLKLDYFNPSNPNNCNFTVATHSPSKIHEIKPIPEINIHDGEMIVCSKHKIRPAISISSVVPHKYEVSNDDGNCVLVAPMYSTQDKAGNYKFSEKFIMQIQAYFFPNLFLLPEDKKYDAKESIVRFDRAVFVPTTYLDHCPLTLSEDAINNLIKWFHFLTLGEFDETISIYKKLLLEENPSIL